MEESDLIEFIELLYVTLTTENYSRNMYVCMHMNYSEYMYIHTYVESGMKKIKIICSC